MDDLKDIFYRDKKYSHNQYRTRLLKNRTLNDFQTYNFLKMINFFDCYKL